MATPSKTWKAWESQLGKWWRGIRNPLSGRNNVDDKGKRRLGDVIVPKLESLEIKYLIEAKLYKNIASIGRAEATCKLAKENQIENWFHFERRNGSNSVIILATSPKWMEKIVRFIVEEMRQSHEQ